MKRELFMSVERRNFGGHPVSRGRSRCDLERVCLVRYVEFRWSLESGSTTASQLGYVPLTGALIKQIEGYWASAFGWRIVSEG